MKRVLALVLSLTILLTGCGIAPQSDSSYTDDPDVITIDPIESTGLTYTGLDDEVLLRQVEDVVYTEAINSLNSSEYVVENVQAIFISKEYIDEVMFNSQSNIYFGYTLDELNELFQGTKYVFTLGEDDQTAVKQYEVIEDTSTEQILKNVAIGTGVILVCVTVSCLTAGSAPAVAAIFAVGAESATTMALSSGAFGAITAGIVRAIQTGDVNEALQAAALAGSEGYKWGAISGSIVGGGSEAFALKAATKNGLTMNEVATIQTKSHLSTDFISQFHSVDEYDAFALEIATKNGFTMNQVALIQKESGYPLSVIKQFHSMEEYNVYKQAGLEAEMVGGELTLVRSDIDLYNVVDEYGRNNFTRLSKGLNPIDSTGQPFEWHHIGQENDATLALLTSAEHDAESLHGHKDNSEIYRNAFAVYKKILNKDLLNWLLSNAA